MAYEALNNAGRLKTNFIIVLNDNNMSISENVGGMSRYLNNLRADEGYNLLKKNVAGTLSRIPMIGSIWSARCSDKEQHQAASDSGHVV